MNVSVEPGMFNEITNELSLIARRAGKTINALQDTDLNIRYKSADEIVTSADHRSHELLYNELSCRFPDIPLIFEEQDNPDVLPQRYIVCDELDGTTNYVKGLSDWGITLAYIDEGLPIAGVLHQPALGKTITAWRGGGSWLNNQQIMMNSTCSLNDSILLIEFNRHLRSDERQWIEQLIGRALAIRCLATSVGSSVSLLSGQAGMYINCRGGKIWDFAAAVLAVEEAGGKATRYDGGKLDWSKLSIGVLLAANDNIAKEALDIATGILKYDST